jgi:tetraacyldisaccharide 4'-kinase
MDLRRHVKMLLNLLRILLSPILLPLSLLYYLAIRIRHFLYDKGIFKTNDLPVAVVSVGNIHIGGTGKTPFVFWLSENLRSNGYKIAILSRGYGRKTKGVVIVHDGQSLQSSVEESGDEAYMLAAKLNNIPTVVAESRYDGAKLIHDRYQPDIIVLDDGMQHRQLHRDIDIVLFNQPSILDHFYLPLGNLRDTPHAARRASFLVQTKLRIGELPFTNKFGRSVDASMYNITSDVLLDKQDHPIAPAKMENIFAFTAIAKPEAFFDDLKLLVQHAQIEKMTFRDHHFYTENEINRLHQEVRNGKVLVTTEKDMVKLQKVKIENLYYLPQEIKEETGRLFSQINEMVLTKLRAKNDWP